jgi:hypothetical protein
MYVIFHPSIPIKVAGYLKTKNQRRINLIVEMPSFQVTNNSMYLTPLKPRKKNIKKTGPLKDDLLAGTVSKEEKTSLAEDVKSQERDTSAGDTSSNSHSKTKRQALKRGILILRRWYK